MKNRWVRRTLIVLLTIAFAFGGLLAYALYKAQQRMDRRIEITPYDVAIPGDAAALERGKYLFSTRGCVDCHGADGAGRAFVDDGSMRIKGPNISPGPGNVVARYSPADWERVLRHGVKPDGRPLMIMPSEDYNRLSDADLGALVAYVKQLPPVAGGAADLRLPLPYRALYGLGKIPDAASIIDHTRKPAAPVAEAVSVAHGEYVSAMCIGCHGEGLSGGKIPTGPPDWPAAPNLTPGEGSVMPRYLTAQSLMAMLRQGRRPDATVITVMPFESFKNISDTDVAALHLYLKSLPPRPAGGR
jgi:mono/diheme cytochrome c family protein